MDFSLSGKVALVTGGSRGIGKAIAVGLAKAGADIIVASRKLEDLEKVVEEINGLGKKAVAIPANIGKMDEVNNLVNKGKDAFGKIDLLVNNAAINPNMEQSLDATERTWDTVMNTNLKGLFFLAQGVARIMKEQGGGKIVNITSGRGLGGQVRGAHYSATKAGMMGFAKTLSLEVAPYGISVNSIAPGPMDTLHWRKGKSPEEIERAEREQDVRNPLLRKILVPEDIVGTVIYLLTDASKVMTGQTIFLRSP